MSNNYRNIEQDRHARAQRRAEKKVTINDFFKTYSFLSFWKDWGRMLTAITLGLIAFCVALYIGNAWILDITHTNGGVGGFFMTMAIFGGILAVGGIGLATGDSLAQQIQRRAEDHYIVVYRSAHSLSFATAVAEDELFEEVIERYLPDAYVELGPEPQEHVCAPRHAEPAHVAVNIPSVEAANQRLHPIP